MAGIAKWWALARRSGVPLCRVLLVSTMRVVLVYSGLGGKERSSKVLRLWLGINRLSVSDPAMMRVWYSTKPGFAVFNCEVCHLQRKVGEHDWSGGSI